MNHSDAHAHLNDMDEQHRTALMRDTERILTCSSAPNNWDLTEKIASEDDKVIPFFGTHPWYTDSYTGAEKLREILSRNKGAGVGEIGLDRKHTDYDEQLRIFTEQISVAADLDRPVAVHMVSAEGDVLRTIRNTKVRTILHSFSGPVNCIKPFNACGCYFSVSPRILNKPLEKMKTVIQNIPSDRLLIETDAPNNSASIEELIRMLATILSRTDDEILSMTTDNLRRFLP